MKRGIKYSLVAFLNLGFGFISVWWFILAYATAVNIDNKSDANDFIPFGIFALILLPILVIGTNYAIYRHSLKSTVRLFTFQIIPFALSISFTYLAIR